MLDAIRTEEPVGDLIADALAEVGVTTAFGVISIHNLPILDAIARGNRIRFVPARTEAGAMSMADAYARVSRSLGVVVTSTGTAAGNAAGAQVEALTAGSPVLHITSQVDRPFMDRDRAAIHDVPRQADMLRAVSKGFFRVWEARSAVAMLEAAARLDALATLVHRARRPMLWLGGGAREASAAARDLVERGFAAVTSTNGRAVVSEAHPRTLGAYTMTAESQAIYDAADLMIVVGSRLRGNETRNNNLRLPQPLAQIDADAAQAARNYPVALFVPADARSALEGLCERLPAQLDVDEQFLDAVAAARSKAEAQLAESLGPYRAVADALKARVVEGRHPFVRDVTLANSTFGNRYVDLAAPHLGVHALGGGIGQGIAMAVGAALARTSAKTIALVGDGGAMVSLGELATVAETKADIVLVLMNDRGYGVIRNIQDAQYGGRRYYADLHTPDFRLIAVAFGLRYQRVADAEDFANALDRALLGSGPQFVEVDMTAIGRFAESFAGPPAGAAGSA